MSRKRVVVTGLGAITPIGNDLDTSWANLLAGKSGIGPITTFDTTDFITKIAGEVKDFDPKKFIEPKKAKRMDTFTHFAVSAAKMLLDDSGFKVDPDHPERTGVSIGVGLGGIEHIQNNYKKLLDKGPKRVSPFFIPIIVNNMAAGMVAIHTNAKGPNICTTTACASGTHAIGTAFSDILLGRVDAVICGGSESTTTELGVGGFTAMKALSTRNDDPTKASRPFDKERDGFVMGEGCGLLLLEELEHAKARGAKIYAEIVGYGASADAYHMTAPPEDGSGMALAMEAAIRDAGLSAEDVDHINAHGTSTPLNDACETTAIKKVFGKRAYDIPVTGNKSMTGHLLGAAGGVESVFTVKTLFEGVIPGTINLENPDPVCDLDYVADGSRQKQVNACLCNSFGFGGTNACVLYKKYED